MRKELVDLGADAGAETIRYHLTKVHEEVPSVSTIWRVLKARGFVTPQPQKRPKSSWHRFADQFPNECWQADVTHVVIVEGTVLEVLDVLDDHSRICVASRAFVTRLPPRGGAQPPQGGDHLGLSRIAPHRQRFGLHVPGSSRDPRTPGDDPDVARHHLEALAPLPSPDLRKGRALPPDAEEVLGEAGARADEEATAGATRPIRRLLQQGPSAPGHRPAHPARGVRGARASFPANPPIDCSGYKVRSDKVDKHGVGDTSAQLGCLHHIGVGRSYSGWRVVMLVAGLDIQIIGFDGSPLRHLTLDPSVDYQRQP